MAGWFRVAAVVAALAPVGVGSAHAQKPREPVMERYSVLVLEPDGSPAVGASIDYNGCGSSLTDRSGHFLMPPELCGPPRGSRPRTESLPAQIHARNGGREGSWAGLWPPAKDLTIRLRPAGSVAGRVVATDGKPVAGFSLKLVTDDRRRHHPSEREPTRFPGLTFNLSDVPAPPATLTALLADGRVGSAPLGKPGEPVTTVAPGARIRGRLVDAASGRPIATGTVWRGFQDNIPAGADGRFELATLLPGNYRVGVVAKPYKQWLTEVSLKAGQFVDLGDIRLEQTTDHCQYTACDVVTKVGGRVRIMSGSR